MNAPQNPPILNAGPPTAPADETRVLSFSVGHGDCTLVESLSNGRIVFRCLVDAGMALPDALLTHLRTNLRDRNEPDIDVVVLTHVDADHQGGLPRLLTCDVTIGEYLGPCLPTFERLKWLFSQPVANAVTRAASMEALLKLRHTRTPIIYPFEGFKTRYANNRVTLSIISPAARLMKRLSLASQGELIALMKQQTLPLQWLLETHDEEDDEAPDVDSGLFDGRVALSPEDFETYPLPRRLPTRDQVEQAAQAASPDLEPEFFGNAVLNDTSLVVILDIILDGHHRKRILFPGDQMNWTYIASQHPAGLGVDVLKAPHHGGRVYLNDRCESLPTMYAWLRPKTVLVSASGRHHLPRAGFREALRAVGSTLLCPNVRTFEPLSAGALLQPETKSCFAAMGCERSPKPYVKVTLTAKAEGADMPSCLQGTGISGLAPIVVLRQDVTVPSEGLVRYTYGELDRHARWINQQLENRRKTFLKRAGESPDTYSITAEQMTVPWSTIAILAKANGRHDLVADPDPVLSFARNQHVFWTDKPQKFSTTERQLACLPTSTNLKAATRWLKSIPRMLLVVKQPQYFNKHVDKLELLGSVDWRVLDHLLASELKLPLAVISTEVRPKLLEIIEHRFAFKICHLRHSIGIYDGGEGYLYLETDPRQFPDLESNDWKSIWAWKATAKDFKAPWPALATMAKKELLAGFYFLAMGEQRSLFQGSTPESRYYYSFVERFHNRNWIDL